MAHLARPQLRLLCATALAGGMLIPSAALACSVVVDDPTAFTCATDSTQRLRNDADGFALTVTGSIDVPNNDALDLRGDGQQVTVTATGTVRGGGDSNALRARGTGLTVDNAGTVEGTDRGIRLSGGNGEFSLFNRETGQILSRRQAVRLDNDDLLPNNRFENWGLIESTEGRAIQSRGPGNVVINHETGVLRGGEEVVEGRMDFRLENQGLIAIRGIDWDPDSMTWTDTGEVVDEDGVQISSGEVHNWGVILSSDDGVDIDEGLVHNYSTGVIISTAPDGIRDSAGIDIDEVLQDPGGRRDGEIPGKVTVINEGYIEGPTGIAADLDAEQPIEITNRGTLIGRGGNAIDLAPGQGDTSITLEGASDVRGDILFGGGGVNTLILGPFQAGAQMEGSISARPAPEDPFAVLAMARFSTLSSFPGTLGAFDVVFDDAVGVSDVLGYLFRDDLFALQMRAGDGSVRFDLFGVQSFSLDQTDYAPESFAAFLSQNNVGVIPLPAPLWLLLCGLGMLAAVGRRRAA